MDILTITCHAAYNVGASLQAFALVTYLKEQGHNARVIDYIPSNWHCPYDIWRVDNPRYSNWLIRPFYLAAKFSNRFQSLKQKRRFDGFQSSYIPLTSRYRGLNELFFYPPMADAYIAGSDQIWNCVHHRNGWDPAYYLNFVRNGKRLAYAASFGVEALPKYANDYVTRQLSNFDFISVREASALNILQNLGISGGCHVVDPVFLLPKTTWTSMASEKYPQLHEDNYLFVYSFDRMFETGAIARVIAKERGLRIYSFFPSDYSDKDFCDAGPLDFLDLINNASFVLSNSFHATAFSIILNKDFACINRKSEWGNISLDVRMRNLLDITGLLERFIPDVASDNWKKEIAWEKVNARVTPLIAYSKDFLCHALLS